MQNTLAKIAPRGVTGDLTSAEFSKSDLDAWLDGLLPFAMEKGDVAGAVVVVVRDGQILTQRGFGWSDVAQRRVMRADQTLIRVGSISKLFTWTAVMQLVDKGKIDLDADVNLYLDFHIPAYHGKPVTMRNLMTHTAGFEERFRDLIVADRPPDKLSIRAKEGLPTRVFGPGTTPAYSNYGAVLAGYIVERVSGIKFEDYVARNIFHRLGMPSSTFAQPVPDRLRNFVSSGYALASDPPKPYEIVNGAPDGALATTGTDMAKFMIDQLADNSLLMSAKAAHDMHDSRLTIIPPLNRMALGYYEQSVAGHAALAHGGDTQWFHAYVWLFPQQHVGLFVAVNSLGRDNASSWIVAQTADRFARRYFGQQTSPKHEQVANAAEHARLIAGYYSASRAGYTTFARVVDLFGQTRVTADADGSLIVSGVKGLNGKPLKWLEVAPFVWRESGGTQRLAARLEHGKSVAFAMDESSPFLIQLRTPWYRSASWLLPAFLAAMLVLIWNTISWPVAHLVRRKYQAALGVPAARSPARRAVKSFAAASLILTLCWAGALVMAANFGLHSVLATILPLLGVLTIVIFPGFLLLTIWDLRLRLHDGARRFSVVRAAISVFVAVTLVWVGVVFNLMTISSNF